MYKVKFGEGENGKIFRTVCHSNGYPCGWEKMGHNNVFVLSASAVSESISAEMSPDIFSFFYKQSLNGTEKSQRHRCCALLLGPEDGGRGPVTKT